MQLYDATVTRKSQLDPRRVATRTSMNSSCSRVPTPSATILRPRFACAPEDRLDRGVPRIGLEIGDDEMSIFRVSIGKCFRCVSDE